MVGMEGEHVKILSARLILNGDFVERTGKRNAELCFCCSDMAFDTLLGEQYTA
jgi:hypothetical protein